MTDMEEKCLSSQKILEARIINVRRDDVLSPKGKCFREVVEHPGGVAIVAFKSDNNILLIKQWRYAAKQPMIELPAGKLEKGEEPINCAKRELTEETGYEAENWEYLGKIYTTPGFCDEVIHLFKATDLILKETKFDEFELIETFITPLDKAVDMVKKGEIIDSKTICGLFHVQNSERAL